MCCGQFKNDFLKQVYVNESLVKISNKVNEQLDVVGKSKKQTVKFMHRELKREEIKIKLRQQLTIAHAKYDDIFFKADGTRQDPYHNHHSSMNEDDSYIGLDSRRFSGKGSSGGEENKNSRRTSAKFIKSDGSSNPDQYCFDERSIDDFIEGESEKIFNVINFMHDEE